MSLKLVAIDLDATLLRDDKTYDTERFDSIVKALEKQGTIFVIASGNSNRKIKSYISDHTLEKIYIAGDNGNDIEIAGQHIQANAFSREALHQISDGVDADGDLQMVVNTIEGSYSTEIYEKDREHIEIFNPDLIMIDSYNDLPEGEEPLKGAILSAKSLDDTKELIERIENNIDEVTAVTSGGGWLDTYSVDGGKGSAVKWIQDEKSISPKQTMAFGDSLNDESMMKHAYYSCAMENGDDDLKAICRYVIGHNEEQAVLDVLEQYIRDGNLDFIKNFKHE